MIRVRKSKDIPPSLQAEGCNHYDGSDVQELLYSDQDGKCYLCEQETHKNFQVEHLKPKAEGYFPELQCEWTNLFLTCEYCNGRKPNSLVILDPLHHDIEDLIVQRVDLYSKKVKLTDITGGHNTKDTIQLLDRLFNGKSNIRDIKGKVLYEDLNREISNFLKKLLDYKSNPTEENKQIIIDLLHIAKEFLGFKYWIIKDSGMYDEFKDFMIWNK